MFFDTELFINSQMVPYDESMYEHCAYAEELADNAYNARKRTRDWMNKHAFWSGIYKTRIRGNVQNWRLNWTQGYEGWNRREIQKLVKRMKRMKERGATFAKLIAQGVDVNTSDVLNALNEYEISSDSVLWNTLCNKTNWENRAIQCEDCDTWVSDYNIYLRSDRKVCNSCKDNYIWSDLMSKHILKDESVEVYEYSGDVRHCDVCTIEYAVDNLYEDGNNEWYIHDPDNDNDDDSDYDDDSNDDCLDDYHANYRTFIEVNETPNIPALGIELEVYADPRRNAVHAVRQCAERLDINLLCEKDGSLSSSYGFEIITQPYGPTEWAILASDLLTTLRNEHVVGYSTPGNEKYGIHVNVHRRHLSPLAEARIMMFLCDTKNRNFVRAISQREHIYDASIDVGCMAKPTISQITHGSNLQKIRHTGELKHRRKIYSADKYAPVNWQDNIAEFRIFNSTLNEISFMKNLEFVWALIAWTKPESMTGISTSYTDFLTWLNTKEYRATYPNLVNYLSRKAFHTKGGSRIVNVWLDLIKTPSEMDTRELLIAA